MIEYWNAVAAAIGHPIRRPAPKYHRVVQRGATVHHGICEAAEMLGVERVHLWLVVTGRRKSSRLLRRYHALKAQQAQQAQHSEAA